jgi:hypothetical protein
VAPKKLKRYSIKLKKISGESRIADHIAAVEYVKIYQMYRVISIKKTYLILTRLGYIGSCFQAKTWHIPIQR